MALIGTISGSNGTSTTAISGSVIIADRPPGEFPSLPPSAKFYVSGTRDVNGPLGAVAIFGGDIFVTGGLGVSDYVQMLPVNELRIPTNTSASYIYTSGSTNDMYFTQYTGPYTNTTRLRWLESALSSGLLHGGILSTQNGTTTFSITSGSGLIVYQNATTSSDPYPTIRFVEWPAYVSQSLQYSGSAQITYIAIDPDGDIDQSPIAFNTEQFKDRVVLGRILHQSGSVSNGATNTPVTAYAVSQNINDFVRAFGPLKISGHFLSASGSAPTLSIVKTAGSSYVEGRNYSTDPNNPNIIHASMDPDITVSKIYREYVSGSTAIIDTGIANAGYTVLNPSLYNNNGTLAAVGNGEFTVQRVFWFPKAVNQAFFVYYGSTKYATMDDAIAGIGVENFIEGGNTAGSAILVGYICLKGDASDLLTTSQARIYQGGLFRGSAGASFGGTGGLDTHVQFNDDNAFGGESGFTFNKLTNSATLVGDINAANANLSSNVNAATASITGNAYTSGTLYAKDISIFGNLFVTASSYFSSSAIFYNGITGSITKLSNGTDYLRAGSNISLTTGSSGEITVAVTGLAGGDVFGPGSATNDAIAVYNGTTGKLIKNSNLLVGTRTTTQAYVTASVNLTNYGLALIPNGTGSLSAQVPDGTSDGGNARGSRATDWQRTRTSAARVASGNNSTIGGGDDNLVDALGGTVAGGATNAVSTARSYGTIGGGQSNTIFTTGTHGTIGGGQGNAVRETHAIVVGGLSNTASGPQSFIGGGTNNTASGTRSSVVCGSGNVVSANNSIVGAGANNTIAGAEYVFVTSQNSSATGNYGGILGGFSSTSSAFGAITLGGQYGVADHHSEVAISPNRFTTNGDSQQSLVTWLRQTTTAATSELTLTGAAPGSGTRFTIASGAKYTVQLGIVASSTTGDTAWWQLAFGIKNVAGTTSLIGSVATITSAADSGASTWTVAVVADDTNDSIQINVTGATSTTINWVASGHLTKVIS